MPECEHVYKWVDGHFECEGCGKSVDFDDMGKGWAVRGEA